MYKYIKITCANNGTRRKENNIRERKREGRVDPAAPRVVTGSKIPPRKKYEIVGG